MTVDPQQPELEADNSHDTPAPDPVPASPARQKQLTTSKERAIRFAQIADELRGKDTLVLDLSGVTSEFDFFVITNGTSPRHLLAIADEVDQTMKQGKTPKFGMEGYNSESWILQDYGDVILHVFTEDARKLYNLERLWGDATVVDWQPAQATTVQS